MQICKTYIYPGGLQDIFETLQTSNWTCQVLREQEVMTLSTLDCRQLGLIKARLFNTTIGK